MGRPFPVSAVQLFVIVLVLLAAYPNVAAASLASADGPAGLSLSSGAAAVSLTRPSRHCDPWNITLCYPYYWGYRWYYPYYGYYPYYWYYYPTTTAEKTETFELKVETSPPGIVPVNGGGTYDQGSIVSFSLTSVIVPLSASERYVFAYWTGAFSGAAPSGAVTMDSGKTVIANYQLEYYLRVSVNPPGVAAPAGDGWYRPGESVVVDAVAPSVSGGEGVRYLFQHWTIDDVPVSGNSVQVTMDIPHTVVARYKTQYKLTVSSDYGTVQGGGWYDAGSSATFSVTTPVDISYGVRQVFERWTGDSQPTSPAATITMDSPHAVTAVWKTDNTILYATIALSIVAAFVLGIGLAAVAITRLPRAKPVPAPAPPKPVAPAETPPEELKTPPAKKRVKRPSKTEGREASSQA